MQTDAAPCALKQTVISSGCAFLPAEVLLISIQPCGANSGKDPLRGRTSYTLA